LPGFFESAGDAVQRVVGEIIGVRATFVLKISDQPTARLEVTLATGVDALVQPDEQMLERAASGNPITLQFGRDALRSSDVRCWILPQLCESFAFVRTIMQPLATRRVHATNGSGGSNVQGLGLPSSTFRVSAS